MRVRPGLEHRPRLPFHSDYDYFGQLVEMRQVLHSLHRGGRCGPLLLEKASRCLQFGHFPAARDAANSCLQLMPACVDAHWLRALAYLGLCCTRLGLIGLSPAIEKDQIPTEPAIEFLDEAKTSLTHCFELTDSNDQEAADLLDYLHGIGESARDSTLREKLRPLLA